VQPLLPVAVAVDEDVGLKCDGLAVNIPQELEVHLVVVAAVRIRRQLHIKGIFACLNKVTNEK
jgi:hypothetical protein